MTRSRIANLSRTDRTILRLCSGLGATLVAGLSLSGIWLFMRHEPAASWDDYTVGALDRPDPSPSEGMSDIHGSLADLAAMLTLFIAIWVSYRVLQQISWTATSALGLVILGLFSGGTIRFNATIRGAVTDTTTAGYAQFFGNEVDLMITDTLDLTMGPARAWTITHLIVLPMAIVLPWLVIRRNERRGATEPARGPSWIDQLQEKQTRATGAPGLD